MHRHTFHYELYEWFTTDVKYYDVFGTLYTQSSEM